MSAFHDNQHKLEDLRSGLDRYGITIVVPDTIGDENPPQKPKDLDNWVNDTDDESTWDCRYKQHKECQGNFLESKSEEEKDQCRQ